MKLRAVLVLTLVVTAVLLAACPTPTPTPPSPTAPAPSPTPEGWARHETPGLVIWLPKTWEILDTEKSDPQTVFAEFQKNNPQLAAVIGSADALKGVSLWAFNRPDSATATLVDNLNIRRVSLEGQPSTNIQAVLDQVLIQYRQLGFIISESKADLKIGDQPAAAIRYTFPIIAGDGKSISADGRQYLVLTQSDLWILSYTIGPGQAAALAPVIEQSAQSFRAK
ncbi:MAG: hypothetical protein NT169_25720 [Chloroflexi bacterium]|nr:hypothetical protein [Chloroflexota bacterium]